MARDGYRIFDADTHIIEPVEPIEAYLSAADKARLDALGPLVGKVAGKDGFSRWRIGKRPDLNRRLGSRDRVDLNAAVDRVSFDPHARVKDLDIEGVDVNMILPSGGDIDGSVAEIRRCGKQD